jgi:hypothetical protein
LVTVIEYAIGCDWRTTPGVAIFVIASSVFAASVTSVVSLAVLFAATLSVVVDDTVAVEVSVVPVIVAALTVNPLVNVAVAPDARLAIVQVIVPVAPTAGVVHDHPTAGEIVWYSAPDGTSQDAETFAAVATPLFFTTTASEYADPGATGSAESSSVTARSALPAATTVVFAVAESFAF